MRQTDEMDFTALPHAAAHAVTRPDRAVTCSQYFVDRWMPLLGGNAVLLVLALRRHGYNNRRTGERRDEIVVGRAELAALTGLSEDTIARELGADPRTGRPRNPWLARFIAPRRRSVRDALGRVRRVENAYWVAMDDPVHPDDWPLAAEAARLAAERAEEAAGKAPEKSAARSPQNAACGEGRRPHSAESPPQSAPRRPQNADSDSAKCGDSEFLTLPDSSRLRPDAAAPPGGSPAAVSEEEDDGLTPFQRSQLLHPEVWRFWKGGRP